MSVLLLFIFIPTLTSTLRMASTDFFKLLSTDELRNISEFLVPKEINAWRCSSKQISLALPPTVAKKVIDEGNFESLMAMNISIENISIATLDSNLLATIVRKFRPKNIMVNFFFPHVYMNPNNTTKIGQKRQRSESESEMEPPKKKTYSQTTDFDTKSEISKQQVDACKFVSENSLILYTVDENQPLDVIKFNHPFSLRIEHCDVCVFDLIAAAPSMIELNVINYKNSEFKNNSSSLQMQRFGFSRLKALTFSMTKSDCSISDIEDMVLQMPDLRVLCVGVPEVKESIYDSINRIINDSQISHLRLSTRHLESFTGHRKIVIPANSKLTFLSVTDSTDIVVRLAKKTRSKCTQQHPLVMEIFKAVNMYINSIGYCQISCMVYMPSINCFDLQGIDLKGKSTSIGSLQVSYSTEKFEESYINLGADIYVLYLTIRSGKFQNFEALLKFVRGYRKNVTDYRFGSARYMPFPRC